MVKNSTNEDLGYDQTALHLHLSLWTL